MAANKALVAVHRYLALALGVFVALMGLSGASLVFKDEIDERTHPERLLPAAVDDIAFEAVIRTARSAVPGATRYSIFVSGDARHAIRVDADGSRPRRLFIDPRDGRLISQAGRAEYFLDWVERLHTHLLAGKTGEYVIGGLGVALLVLAITGIVQAWPRRWSIAFRIRWRAESPWLAYDLHRVGGMLAVAFLLVSATTGIVLAFSGTAVSLVNLVAGSSPPAAPASATASERRTRAPLDDVVRAAERALPGSQVTRVVVDADERAPVALRIHSPSDRHPSGLGSVAVDPFGAKVTSLSPLSALSAGQRMFDWIFPLHIGRLLGTPHRSVLVAVGLAPMLLLATGLILWARRRKARPRQR